jgi:CHASE2 domain-containing sensor protein
LAITGLIIVLRLLGQLQPLEWWAFDTFLRLRPPEPTDAQILIVGINEADIQASQTYPIPDSKIAALIEQLQVYQPRAIGLDIIRDLPVEPGHAQLTQLLQKSDSLIGIEKALPDAAGGLVKPPPGLPPERVGFADVLDDADGALRRALIGTPIDIPTQASYKFSLPLLLTERYLAAEHLVMENGLRDTEAVRFGKAEFSRFEPNSGGYVNADAGGNQFLINYRSGKQPFRVVSMSEVIQNKVPPDWINDRLILIGMTATSVGDRKQTNAVSDSGSIYGVEVHAHIASQMIHSALNQRPWIKVWPDIWEYIWIVAWGVIGLCLGRFMVSPIRILLGAGLLIWLLIGFSFTMLLQGWWLAVVPACLALAVNSVMSALFYRYQQEIQSRLHERQRVIDQIYTEIHNMPVQTLAGILRNLRSGQAVQEADLQRLEQELRAIEESARQATTQTAELYLCGNAQLNLQQPLGGLLHEVYRTTLNRTQDFPIFATVIKVPEFADIENRRLTSEQRRSLCRFLEEALCNAGKYAEGMKKLEVSCKTHGSWNVLRVADNGAGLKSESPAEGYGTKQAKRLARQLGGKFQRIPHSPKGTICELRYPVQPWRRVWRKFLRNF